MARAAFVVLVVLHVLCAVIGFGSLGVSGVYGFGAGGRRNGPTREETGRYFSSPGRLPLLLLAVPFLGVAALAVEPHGGGVAQLWAGLAAAVWLAAAAALLGLARPAERRLRQALDEGDGAALAAAGARLGWTTVATDVAFLVALGLMVSQPR